ncbi:carboxypeptidase regulatory-like domain-containing protein [Silvibacterium acidisoli]|uniref:carboxypeptidase regulatory-like domain-containing protein n=1 Tax=Acidobacteriaceae bacterium ZG23-2 TaxID=2883246 RepID=UPI00406D16F3
MRIARGFLPVSPVLFRASCVTILATSALYAQTTSGAISGTVTDPSGAAIAGAQLNVLNVDTHESHILVSNKSGNYIFPSLVPGRYELVCTAAGFTSERQTSITVNVNENAHVSFALSPGRVDQAVTVSAATPGIDATESQLGQTIDQEQIRDLPLNGRSAYGLALLSPGVSNYTGTVATGSYNGVYFSTNGMRINSNSFFLDGAYNTAFFRDTGNLLPNPDALHEFRVLSSNYDAEFGRLPGAVVNVITKSGTNAYHGLLYDYLRNDALNAHQEFVTGTTPLKQNQFGGNFGGPIHHDKIFFFLSYEGLQIHTPTIISSSSIVTPTPAEAAGDLSALPASKYPKQANGTVYSCNGKAGVICPNLLDPVAQGILKAVPLTDPATGVTPQQTSNSDSSSNEGLGRVDAQLTQNHKLSFTAFISRGFTYTPTGGSNEILSYSGTDQTNGLSNFILDENWVVSPSKLNDINLSFTLNHSIIGNIHDNNYLSSLGSKISEGALLQTQPYVSITGYFIAGSGSSSQDNKTQQSLAAYDNFLWTRGNHQIKLGGNFVWNRYADTGVYDGSTASTFTGGTTGNALADFLLGDAATFRQNSGTYYRLHQSQPALYAQDSWRITRRLTLNAGLRWEVFSPLAGNHSYGTFVPYQQSTRFPTAPVGLVFSGDHDIPNGIFHTQWKDFSPRVGFAYDVYGKGTTVLRGGFGIFYSGFEGGDTENLQQQPYALDLTLTKTTSLANPYGATADPFPYVVSTTNPVFQSGASISALPPNGNSSTPYVEEYNLNVEQQLARHWLAQIAYVGNASRKQYIVRDENAPIYAPGASTATAALNARRPYQPTPNTYTYAGIYELAPIGSGSYNALQLTLSRHFEHNFSLLANYTWEKVIDVVGSDVSSISATQLTDDNDPARDRGISVLNVPQIFVASASYEVPHFKQYGFAGRNVLGGWQLNTLVQLHSGSPINILSGVDSNLNGTNNDRPNLVGNPYLPGGRSRTERIAEYFNTTAFAKVPAGTPYGNVARDSLVGPGYANVDFSAFKDISLWHQHTLQIRGEFFNLFNHVNLSNPTATLSSSLFGKISSAGSPRVTQVAARYYF